jgi:hypothetical protein
MIYAVTLVCLSIGHSAVEEATAKAQRRQGRREENMSHLSLVIRVAPTDRARPANDKSQMTNDNYLSDACEFVSIRGEFLLRVFLCGFALRGRLHASL